MKLWKSKPFLALMGLLAVGGGVAIASLPSYNHRQAEREQKTAFHHEDEREGESEENEAQEATFAAQIAEERYKKRLDAKGLIPTNALMLAKQHVDQMPVATWFAGNNQKGIGLEDAGIKGWEWLGPGNIGGRIRSDRKSVV